MITTIEYPILFWETLVIQMKSSLNSKKKFASDQSLIEYLISILKAFFRRKGHVF